MGLNASDDLSAAQLSELRTLLEQIKDDAERGLSASAQDSKPVDLDLPIGRLSRVDALQQQSMATARRQRVELRLQQVRAAFSRLDAGSYGGCISCGEAIGYPRLRVKPETPFCRACQAGGGA